MGERPSVVGGLDVSEVEDGLVVYDPRRDRVHYLNPTAALVFMLCDGTRDMTGIADAVGNVYGLDEPPVGEVEACLAQFRDEEVLR